MHEVSFQGTFVHFLNNLNPIDTITFCDDYYYIYVRPQPYACKHGRSNL